MEKPPNSSCTIWHDTFASVYQISVYKSILIKENNTWYGKEAQFGYAKIQYLPNSSIIAIDIISWHR